MFYQICIWSLKTEFTLKFNGFLSDSILLISKRFLADALLKNNLQQGIYSKHNITIQGLNRKNAWDRKREHEKFKNCHREFSTICCNLYVVLKCCIFFCQINRVDQEPLMCWPAVLQVLFSWSHAKWDFIGCGSRRQGLLKMAAITSFTLFTLELL